MAPPADPPTDAEVPPARPVPDWGQELTRLWSRVGSTQLAVAGVLIAVAVILVIVGLQMTLAAEASSLSELHGEVWLLLSTTVLWAALGWSAAARPYRKWRVFWSPGTDLLVAVAIGALALIFGLVTLGLALGSEDRGTASPPIPRRPRATRF